jgi:undecaprenyl-diphosphatase
MEGIPHQLRHLWRRLVTHAGHEPLLLLTILLVSTALWALAALADAVMEGHTYTFDEAVLLAMRTPGDLADPWGPRWFETFLRDCTALGDAGVLTVIMLVVCGFLLLQDKTRMTVLVVVAVAGAMLVSTLLKRGFDRPRPALVPHAVRYDSASFPRGHAMHAAVVSLTLGAWLARGQPHRWLKSSVLGVAVVLTALVGGSRVYRGVHWPTDVRAGWAAGAAWALGIWGMAFWLQQHGEMEPDDCTGQRLSGKSPTGGLAHVRPRSWAYALPGHTPTRRYNL